ncbi:MAG: glycerate kinase, partial [Clostridia bacterium]|nr:glycerate kinase [Clostridia bacterium]
MTSVEAARAAADGIRAAGCEAALYSVPAADGGEGTMEAFLSALGG